MKMTMYLLIGILSIGLISAVDYSDCSIYGNCPPTSTGSSLTVNNINTSLNGSYVPYNDATNNVNLGIFNLTTMSIGTFGTTYQAVLGDDANTNAGYFTDGTQTVSLTDGDGSNFDSGTGFTARLGSATEGGYFTGGSATVYLTDGSYAINSVGNSLFTDSNSNTLLFGGDDVITATRVGGLGSSVSSTDGTNFVYLTNGVNAITSTGSNSFTNEYTTAYLSEGNILGDAGYFVFNDGVSTIKDVTLSTEGYAGAFSDVYGGNNVFLSSDDWSLDVTGSSQFIDGDYVSILTPSGIGAGGYFINTATGIEALLSSSVYGAIINSPEMSTYINDENLGYAGSFTHWFPYYYAYLGTGSYAGYFSDGMRSVTLADVTYIINATGNSYFNGNVNITGNTNLPSGSGTNLPLRIGVSNTGFYRSTSSGDLVMVTSGSTNAVFGTDYGFTVGGNEFKFNRNGYSDFSLQVYNGGTGGSGTRESMVRMSNLETNQFFSLAINNTNTFYTNRTHTEVYNNFSVNGNTNLKNTTIVGNLNQTNGNATINNIFGGIYYHNDSGGTFPFASEDVFYNFTYGNCGVQNGFICNSTTGTLTAQFDGVYKINYIATGTGANNHLYHIRVAINDIGQNNTESHGLYGNGTTLSLTGVGHIRINATQKINLQIEDSSGTGDGTVYNWNFVIERIGN